MAVHSVELKAAQWDEQMAEKMELLKVAMMVEKLDFWMAEQLELQKDRQSVAETVVKMVVKMVLQWGNFLVDLMEILTVAQMENSEAVWMVAYQDFELVDQKVVQRA